MKKQIMIEVGLDGAEVFIPQFYDHEAGFEKGARAVIPFDVIMSKQELFDKISKTVIQFLMVN